MNESGLVGVAIIEKDSNNDVLLVWSYPEIPEEIEEEVIISKTCLKEEEIPLQFIYSKFKNNWIYTFAANSKDDLKDDSATVVAYSICLLTDTFNPEKYGALCKLMSDYYGETSNPVSVLEAYLSVFARGKYSCSSGSFILDDYQDRMALLVTSIKDVISMFGEQIILIWTALLLKKRIIVYSNKLSLAQKVLRGFPLLVWHRQNWNILRPFVAMSKPDIQDLQTCGIYVACFTDQKIKNQDKYYDLFVDIDSKSATVPAHAKNSFILGSFHKDLTKFLVEAANSSEVNDQQIIKQLAVKTRDLLENLKNLATEDEEGNSTITLEGLQSRKLPPNMDRFLFSVATAENMVN